MPKLDNIFVTEIMKNYIEGGNRLHRNIEITIDQIRNHKNYFKFK
jgi:hypothetical protein